MKPQAAYIFALVPGLGLPPGSGPAFAGRDIINKYAPEVYRLTGK